MTDYLEDVHPSFLSAHVAGMNESYSMWPENQSRQVPIKSERSNSQGFEHKGILSHLFKPASTCHISNALDRTSFSNNSLREIIKRSMIMLMTLMMMMMLAKLYSYHLLHMDQALF